MIRPLRAVHRWGFAILAIVVVAVLYLSLVTRPDYPKDSIPDSFSQPNLEADSTDVIAALSYPDK